MDYPCAGHECGCESLRNCMDQCCCYPSLEINKVNIDSVDKVIPAEYVRSFFKSKVNDNMVIEHKKTDFIGYNSCTGGRDDDCSLKPPVKKYIECDKDELVLFISNDHWVIVNTKYCSLEQMPPKKVPIVSKLA